MAHRSRLFSQKADNKIVAVIANPTPYHFRGGIESPPFISNCIGFNIGTRVITSETAPSNIAAPAHASSVFVFAVRTDFIFSGARVLRPAAGGATSIAVLMLVSSFGFRIRSGSGFVSVGLCVPSMAAVLMGFKSPVYEP